MKDYKKFAVIGLLLLLMVGAGVSFIVFNKIGKQKPTNPHSMQSVCPPKVQTGEKVPGEKCKKNSECYTNICHPKLKVCSNICEDDSYCNFGSKKCSKEIYSVNTDCYTSGRSAICE